MSDKRRVPCGGEDGSGACSLRLASVREQRLRCPVGAGREAVGWCSVPEDGPHEALPRPAPSEGSFLYPLTDRFRAEKAEAALAAARREVERWRQVIWTFSDRYGRLPRAPDDLAQAATLEEYEAALGVEVKPATPPPIPSKVACEAAAVSSSECKGCFYEPDNGHCPSHPRPDWSCWTKMPDC